MDLCDATVSPRRTARTTRVRCTIWLARKIQTNDAQNSLEANEQNAREGVVPSQSQITVPSSPLPPLESTIVQQKDRALPFFYYPYL